MNMHIHITLNIVNSLTINTDTHFTHKIDQVKKGARQSTTTTNQNNSIYTTKKSTMAKEKQTKKEQRAAALATLKSRRHHQFSSSSALDSYDASAAQDVQDILDDLGSDNEMEYRKRVEANLAKEDFVVDDGEFFFYFNKSENLNLSNTNFCFSNLLLEIWK